MKREEVKSVSPLALGLLVQFEQHISSQLLLLRYDEDRNWGEPRFDGGVAERVLPGSMGQHFLGLWR